MLQMIQHNKLLKLLLKFFSVGVLATLVHSGIYSAYLAFHPNSAQTANLIAYLIALCVSYIGQRYWTFSSNLQNNRLITIVRFILVSLIGYGLNALWVYITTITLALSAYFALLGIGILTPLVTFLLLNVWVFTSQTKVTVPVNK